MTGRPVLEEFTTRSPATLELAAVALIFAIGIGIPLYYLAARHYGRFWDHSSVVLSLSGITVPVFVLAFIHQRHARHRLLRSCRDPHQGVGRVLCRADAPGLPGIALGTLVAVVLPEPESPTIATVRPHGISRLTLRTAWKSPALPRIL